MLDLETLRKTPLFSRLDDQRLDAIAEIARLDCVAAGGFVVREREPAGDLRIVVDGRVSITIEAPGKGEVAIATVSAGEVLGWSALLDREVWLASARALKNTTMVVVAGSELIALCESDHELGYQVHYGAFQTVARRLQDSWLQLMDAYR